MISQVALMALFAATPLPTAAAEQPDLASLERVLDSVSTDTSEARFSTAITQALLGSVLLVPGLVLANRSDPELQFIGTGFIVGGSIQLGVAPLLLIPTPVERIRSHLRERMSRGEGAQDLADSIETELREAALRKRRSRPIVGAIALALGAGSLATGMTFLIAQPGLAGMGRQTQYIWGAALVGAGAPFVAAGLHSLLQRSPEESAWEAYVASRGRNHPVPSGVSLASFFVVPTPRGTVGAVGFVF